jgi:hypothetical protein
MLMRPRSVPTVLRTVLSAIVLPLVALLTHRFQVSAEATQGWKMVAAVVAALIAFLAVVAALIAFLAVVAVGFISERFWRVVRVYARTGVLPADLAYRANRADGADGADGADRVAR